MKQHLITLFFFLVLFSSCHKPEDSIVTIELNDRVKSFFSGDVYIDGRQLTEEEKYQLMNYSEGLPVANLVMGKDSFQIGVETIGGEGTGKVEQDFLFLNAYGDTIAPDSHFRRSRSRGLITRKSLFTIEKNSYWITELDSTRSTLKVMRMEDRMDIDPIAKLSVRMKRLPLVSLRGDTINFTRPEGKRMLIFFVHLTALDFPYLHKLNDHWESLPQAYRDQHEVIVVHRFKDKREELRAYLSDNPISLPFFFEADGTCNTIDCYGGFPYYLSVNEAGRITDYFALPGEIGWPGE